MVSGQDTDRDDVRTVSFRLTIDNASLTPANGGFVDPDRAIPTDPCAQCPFDANLFNHAESMKCTRSVLRSTDRTPTHVNALPNSMSARGRRSRIGSELWRTHQPRMRMAALRGLPEVAEAGMLAVQQGLHLGMVPVCVPQLDRARGGVESRGYALITEAHTYLPGIGAMQAWNPGEMKFIPLLADVLGNAKHFQCARCAQVAAYTRTCIARRRQWMRVGLHVQGLRAVKIAEPAGMAGAMGT